MCLPLKRVYPWSLAFALLNPCRSPKRLFASLGNLGSFSQLAPFIQNRKALLVTSLLCVSAPNRPEIQFSNLAPVSQVCCCRRCQRCPRCHNAIHLRPIQQEFQMPLQLPHLPLSLAGRLIGLLYCFECSIDYCGVFRFHEELRYFMHLFFSRMSLFQDLPQFFFIQLCFGSFYELG
jgi:hypothetical protein